jgi:YD repeat-containing protein
MSVMTPGASLSVERNEFGQAVAVTGAGLRHRVTARAPGSVRVDDDAGTTTVRQLPERTELQRDGHVLARSLAGPATEAWEIPGTRASVFITRDADGDVQEVRVGSEVIAHRADSGDARLLCWATGAAGESATGAVAVDSADTRHAWDTEGNGATLAFGRDRYGFDTAGRVVEHHHPATGRHRYRFAGTDLVAVETPLGDVELHAGVDGRPRVRRSPDGHTTYGYDDAGRRVREDGTRARRLAYDDLDRLLEVHDSAWVVRYGYDGFGRRVERRVTTADGTSVTLEHRDLQGRLWSVTDVSGRPVRTWLWDRHRCLAAFDGPAGPADPAAVYVCDPNGTPVGFVDGRGRVRDIPRTPYGEGRPAGHPALAFHFADDLTGYLHMTQRDFDPSSWAFLTTDPYRDDAGDLRRSILGAEGPLATEPSGARYALCGFDPVRRVDPNGAVSFGTVLWQIFGGLTWHSPAHIINFLWIHPFVNLPFASILAWLPALGVTRGGFDSWYEFWQPSQYSVESSERQDIGGFLMAGWMSANRTFTFQNAIWGRTKTWDPLGSITSFEPASAWIQQRWGSLVKIFRGGNPNADVIDTWTIVADGIDATAGGNRRFDCAGGREHEPILGDGRDRLMTGANLHVLRQVQTRGVNVPQTHPSFPLDGLVDMHSQATGIQECAPASATATVTLRAAGRIFTHPGTDAATADGDVVTLNGVLTVIEAVQVQDPGGANERTELSVRAGHGGLTLPAAGGGVQILWFDRDPAGAQALNAHPAGGDRLELVDAVVAWTPGSAARVNGTAVTLVDQVESHVPVRAQDNLAAGADMVPLGAPVPVPGATLGPDEHLLVPTGTVPNTTILRLERGGDVRLARVTNVAPGAPNDDLTLHATPTDLGLPGAGDPVVAQLTRQPSRGTLDTAITGAPTAASAVIRITANTALGNNIAGFEAAAGLVTVTGPETRAIRLAPNPLAAAGPPWNVERFTIDGRAKTGVMSGNVEMVQFDAGDGAATIPLDALLRFRAGNVPAANPVAGLGRVDDRSFSRPGADATINDGDLLVVAGAATTVVTVADVAVEVTLDREVGAQGERIRRVYRLAAGERTYDVTRVADDTVRIAGTAGGNPALLPDWVEGEIVQVQIAGTTEEWVLGHDADGGRLQLRTGPGAILPGANGDTGTIARMVPRYPPLAAESTTGSRTSDVLAPTAAGPSRHRWVASTGNVQAGPPFAVQIGDRVAVTRVASVELTSFGTSPLPAAPLTGYARMAAAGANDRIVARWRIVGDEILLDDQRVPTPAGATVILDALGPVQTVVATPRAQGVMCPAEPENERWIFSARQALAEHELRHTLQSSVWGPLMLGLPLGVAGDLVWDLRGGSGSFQASEFNTVERVPETTSGEGGRARPAGFRLPRPIGDFRMANGEIVEFDGTTAWRTVITAVEIDAAPGPTFWVQNPPPDDFGGTSGLRARTIHHTTPELDGWFKLLRILDLLTNAHIMEFTSGLVWEGLIGLFWRIGRLFDFAITDSADVTVVAASGRTKIRAADTGDLQDLRLQAGSQVLLDSTNSSDDTVSTVVTAIDGPELTLRDPVPGYPASARIRLWRHQGKTPDAFWDLRSYTPASFVGDARNVFTYQGSDQPSLSVLDAVKVKWNKPNGETDSKTTRVSGIVDAAAGTYQLQDTINIGTADPDTLRVSGSLGSDDDPNEVWFNTRFYETPIRMSRVTKYLFDPWRELTLDTGFVQPADGATWKKVLAWITRSLRYALSNRTWTPFFGYVWWTSVFGDDHESGLEQTAAWHSGDLYTTLTRSGDPRFAESEGSHGDDAGDYRIFEGELLRMWMWEQWRWNDVFASVEPGVTKVATNPTPSQNPALSSAATNVTPWDDRWRFTPPAGLVAGLEYPAELARTVGAAFRPSPLLQIPTRRDVARTSGVYFVACQAGQWTVGPPNPSTRDNEAQNAGAQFHTRTVNVRPLTVQAGGVNLPWQVGGAAPLTLFITQEQRISVTGGNNGTYRLQLLDNASGELVFRDADLLTLRARLTTGTEAVEVVRVYETDDAYFARFGTYLHKPIAIPVRRFLVAVSDEITLRTGPAATDPAIGGPVAAGAVISALLPVTAAVLPTAAYDPAAPPGSPPPPTVSGPIAAGDLHRYDIAVNPTAPTAALTVAVRFTFADPLVPATTRDIIENFTVEP